MQKKKNFLLGYITFFEQVKFKHLLNFSFQLNFSKPTPVKRLHF